MDLSEGEKPALQRSTESAFGRREEESQTVMNKPGDSRSPRGSRRLREEAREGGEVLEKFLSLSFLTIFHDSSVQNQILLKSTEKEIGLSTLCPSQISSTQISIKSELKQSKWSLCWLSETLSSSETAPTIDPGALSPRAGRKSLKLN